jgi:hypothetical protein
MGTPQVLTQQVDATTWQALGLVLTLVGLLVSVVVWRRAGTGHGLRAVAWSLVPLAAGLTGLLRLGWEVLDSLLRWATRLVFSPVVWLGVALAALAIALHVAGSVLVRRADRAADKGRSVESAPRGELQSPPRRSAEASAEDSTATPSRKQSRKQRRQDEQVVEDQDDIEAILRKHGIS